MLFSRTLVGLKDTPKPKPTPSSFGPARPRCFWRRGGCTGVCCCAGGVFRDPSQLCHSTAPALISRESLGATPVGPACKSGALFLLCGVRRTRVARSAAAAVARAAASAAAHVAAVVGAAAAKETSVFSPWPFKFQSVEDWAPMGRRTAPAAVSTISFAQLGFQLLAPRHVPVSRNVERVVASN